MENLIIAFRSYVIANVRNASLASIFLRVAISCRPGEVCTTYKRLPRARKFFDSLRSLRIPHPRNDIKVTSSIIYFCIIIFLSSPALADFTSSPYWYKGKAEITSYDLKQARYGEIHKGHAVLIFVTEDFSKKKHVKLDNPLTAGNDRVPILKLNLTKKFNTGIYPYSLMTSVFSPVNNTPTLKVTSSAQEWCGHTFSQLNLRDDSYRFSGYSYFESEGDQNYSIKQTLLEDEIWNRIRLAPDSLPTGEISIIPSTTLSRLKHFPLEATSARATKTKSDVTSTYKVSFASPKHSLTITFNNAFPHEILGWEETYSSGWGANAKTLTTTATKKKTLLTNYWVKNKTIDEKLRRELELP